jgi:hypothetical protein
MRAPIAALTLTPTVAAVLRPEDEGAEEDSETEVGLVILDVDPGNMPFVADVIDAVVLVPETLADGVSRLMCSLDASAAAYK